MELAGLLRESDSLFKFLRTGRGHVCVETVLRFFGAFVEQFKSGLVFEENLYQFFQQIPFPNSAVILLDDVGSGPGFKQFFQFEFCCQRILAVAVYLQNFPVVRVHIEEEGGNILYVCPSYGIQRHDLGAAGHVDCNAVAGFFIDIVQNINHVVRLLRGKRILRYSIPPEAKSFFQNIGAILHAIRHHKMHVFGSRVGNDCPQIIGERLFGNKTDMMVILRKIHEAP